MDAAGVSEIGATVLVGLEVVLDVKLDRVLETELEKVLEKVPDIIDVVWELLETTALFVLHCPKSP